MGAKETLEANAVRAVTVLREEEAIYGSPEQYVRQLVRRYRQTLSEEVLNQISDVVEPIDPVLGRDPEGPTAVAFCVGGLLGVRTAEVVIGKGFDQQLHNVSLPLDVAEKEKDAVRRIHRLGVSVIHIGDKGYASTPELLRELVESWEDSLCPDIRHQAFVRRGFGLIAYMTEGVLKQADLQQMTEEAEALASGDWDAGLSELLGN